MKSTIPVHEMKVAEPWFSRMDLGVKTIELRLLDEKRQTMKIGDHVSFKLFPKLEHSCLMEITGLLHYPNFASLIDDINVAWLGYEEKDREWLKSSMYDIYTQEEEKEFGALGIRLKKVSK